MENNELYHHGILGQKWGVRRYQNPDGSLTELGKQRYKKTVFVSGSSKTQDPNSGYYRKKLPRAVRKEIDEYAKGQSKFVVGDAPGIDRQVQDYLHKKGYSNVEVYGPGKQVRYTADEKWKTNPIDNPNAEVGSKEWLAVKDIVMSNIADVGIAVVLDEGAKATRKNVERLVEQNKDVKVYQLIDRSKNTRSWFSSAGLIDDAFHEEMESLYDTAIKKGFKGSRDDWMVDTKEGRDWSARYDQAYADLNTTGGKKKDRFINAEKMVEEDKKKRKSK